MKNIYSVLIITFLLFSCHQKQSDKTQYELAEIEEDILSVTKRSQNEAPIKVESKRTKELTKKKIIKDGRMGLRVLELENTKLQIDTLIRIHGAYYSNERYNNTDWESSYVLKIRVPSAHFEDFISEIESGSGEILYKEIDARDVTDEFIDLKTRLENKRNYLKRYRDLLKQAKSIKEILEIEEKIRRLEEEIESTTGRLKYLSDLVDYSTLDLTLTKRKDFKYNPENRDRFTERLKQSVSKGWHGFVDFLLAMIKIWPFWIILSLLLYFWKRYRMKKKENNPSPKS